MSCRIVICDLSGQYIDQIGGNGPALQDGGFDSAAFNRPQGLAFSQRRGRLYVADTENHALREVSLCCRRHGEANRGLLGIEIDPLRSLLQPCLID